MDNKYITYATKDSKLLCELESAIMKFVDNYKVNEWRIPSLISGDILRKCGYFKIMPDQLTVAGFYTNDQCMEIEDSEEHIGCTCENMFFTPAACIHFYPEIKKYHIVNELITTNARVYRHESGNFSESRLWDFNVREFVAVGDKKYVTDFLVNFKKKSLELGLKYDKGIKVSNASDHFYPTKRNAVKEKMQLANNLKYELISSDDVAIASFNYHDFHFSKAFDFDKEGAIVTGCVGFGLDRWLPLLRKEI